ncbi:unnamed protein product [Calypogeia fissa]
MEGSSRPNLFPPPPSAPLSSSSSSFLSPSVPSLHVRGETAIGAAVSSSVRLDEDCSSGNGALHGAGIGLFEQSRVVGEHHQEGGGEREGLDCNGVGDGNGATGIHVGIPQGVEFQGKGGEGSVVPVENGEIGFMDVGGGAGEDDEDVAAAAARQRVEEFDDYMPLAGVEEGFQFGQVDAVLEEVEVEIEEVEDEAGGTDGLALANESEGGDEAWIAEGMDPSNYNMGTEGDSIFDEAIREIINKSTQAAAEYGHPAEVPEDIDGMEGLDGAQELNTTPEAEDSVLFSIDDVEVEGVSDRDQVEGLPQGSGASEFAASRGMDVTTLSDQDLFETEERQQFCQAEGASNDSRNDNEALVSEHIECGVSSPGKYCIDEVVQDGDGPDGLQGAPWPPTIEQELYSPRQESEPVLASEQSSDRPQVANEFQEDAGDVLGSTENEGSSDRGHPSFAEDSKDGFNPSNGDNRGMIEGDKVLDGADVHEAGQDSEEDGNLGVEDDQGEREGSASPQSLSKDGSESNGTEFTHPTVQPSSATAWTSTVSAKVPGEQSERSVKQHQSNGVRVSFDTKTVELLGSKGSKKSSGKEKMEAEVLQEGEGVPLWVKWRGKWEAAIRCSVIDCPPTTLKAKPNYSKKKHVVAYFPSARLFSWVDTQHTCPIGENPVPLLAGTHFTQREAVKDGFLPRRRMLLKLGGEILDISDRLHIMAVVERAQDVNVWKTFAKEAAAATMYSELGELLVRLHLTIAPIYIKDRWTSQRYSYWKEECANAESAAGLQKLTRELINAVRWDAVAPLWNASEQPELDPEWEHWKGDAFEEKDSDDERDPRGSKAPRDGSPIGAQISSASGSKRFKEQARARRQPHHSSDAIENSSQKRLKVNSVSPEVQLSGGPGSSSFGHATTAFRSPLVHLSLILGDKATGVSEGPVAFNSGLCTAFLKRKTRRCNRPVKEDITYCGKHKHLADPVNRGKELEAEGGLAWESGLCSASLGQQFTRCPHAVSEGSIFCQTHIHLGAVQSTEKNGDDDFSTPIKESRCHGMTTRGVRCTHKPQDGSRFCAKHSSQGAEGQNEESEARIQLQGSEDSASKRVRTSRLDSQNGSPVQIEVGQVSGHRAIAVTHGNGLLQGSTPASTGNDGLTRKRKWVSSFFHRQAVNHVKSPLSRGQDGHLRKVSNGTGTPSLRCKGRTTRDGDQCSFRARPGHSLCTKHLLASEGGRKLLEDDSKVSSSVSSAKGLLERFLKSADEISSEADGLVAREQLLKSTTEAAQDYSTAEELLKLVTMEMSRLNTYLRPTTAVNETKSEVKPALPGLVNGNAESRPVAGTSKVTEESTSVTCGLCGLAVLHKEDLGKHWKESHRKDVIVLAKGYACRACGHLYSRKHTVRRHWRKRHQSLPVRSPDWLAVCSSCSSRFDSHDSLLQHVCAAHPDQLSSPALRTTALENRDSEAVDAAETLECDDCHEEFVTHWDLFHHKERIHKSLKNEVIGPRMRSSGDTKHKDNYDSSSQAAPQLFGCRNCEKKFPSLPDLHRHADAEHSIGPPAGSSSKSAYSSDSGRVKLQIRRKSDEKGSGSWQSGSGPRRRKKRGRFLKQSDNNLEIEKETLLLRMKVALHTAQLRNLRQLKRSDVPTARPRKALYSLTKGGQMLPFDSETKCAKIPDDRKLLDMAQSVCCQSKLLTALHQKYIKLPDHLLVRVSQVCTDANVKLEWLADGYLCPNGCKEFRISMDEAESASEPMRTVKAEVKLNEKDAGETVKYLPNSGHMEAKSRTIIISADLSNGLEPVPVVCSVEQGVVDSWRRTHKDESSSSETFKPDSFNYITQRVLNPALGVDPENYKVGCSCEGHQCSPESCDHVDIFDNDNLDALDIYGKPMKGRFPYDNKGCIILEEGYLVYECNSSCRCQQTCQNRVLQKGVTVKLEVFKTMQKGWAVRAAQMIPRGTFVCEYLGEVLHDEEANKRGERYDQVGCSYLYDIDAHLDTSGRVGRAKPFVIDATKHGNVARFINHSCAPNLVNYQVLVDSMDCQLAHIGLFASRDIESGEELAYDYRYKLLPGKGCPCHCGASNCRGRLY